MKAGRMEGRGVIGLIAGEGRLPAAIAKEAGAMGYSVVAVALEGLADDALRGHADQTERFNVGKAGAIIRYLKKNGADRAVMAGKVPKTLLYGGGIRPDLRAVSILMRLKDRRDDSILDAVAREFEKDGITILDMKDFCPGMMTPEGVLTRKGPSREEKKDVEFGLRMAKEIGRLDIGQTIVVKSKAVMAVEAIEGTDEAIKRGGALAGGGAVVVKASRPGQDMRFDVPAAGLSTLRSMAEAGARLLALEAGRSILIDREEALALADREGITVMGVKG